MLILAHYLGKIAGLRPAIFSGTPRNSGNQILSIINSKKWPESPQKLQKIQKSIMLKYLLWLKLYGENDSRVI